MKGFFKWFSNSTKMKRWIFLILIGIVLAKKNTRITSARNR